MEFLGTNTYDIADTEMRPPISIDLNAVDFLICSVIESWSCRHAIPLKLLAVITNIKALVTVSSPQ